MPFLLRFRRKPSGGGTTRLYLPSGCRLGSASESPNDHPAGFLQAAARVNGRIQEMKGTSLQDPETRLHALQSAVLALMSGVARKNGMPHALEAMQRLQAYNPH